MVSRRTDRLLHKITHHTNLEQPYNEYLTSYKYPNQDSAKLGTIIRMKYKNRYISKSLMDSDEDIDDKDEYTDNIFEGDFIILRYDIDAPYRLITMQTDYRVMLVADTRNYQDIVHVYPKQIEEYLGLYLHNQYFETPDSIIRAVVLSCDSTTPGESIIAEFYVDNTVRFVTDTETQSIVLDRYDADGERDFNGKTPSDHGFIYIDLNGKFARSEGESITIDANGGYPDPLQDMYRSGILSKKEVLKLRGRIIMEREIYGCNTYPTGISIEESSIELRQNEEVQLHVNLEPPGAISRILYTSSNNRIARVNSKGIVVGADSGTVTITATTEFGGYTDTCEATVIVPVAGIDFKQAGLTIELQQDEEFQLEAKIKPKNATNKKINYISDNEYVIVSEDGLISLREDADPYRGYSATITVESDENPEIKSTCTIDYAPAKIKPSSIILHTGFKGPYVDNNSGEEFYFLASYGEINTNPASYLNPIDYKLVPDNTTETKIYWKITNVNGSTTNEADIINTDSDEGGYYTDTGSITGLLPGVMIRSCNISSEGTRTIYKISAYTEDHEYIGSIFIARGNPITGLSFVAPRTPIKGLDTGVLRVKINKLYDGYACTNTDAQFSSSDSSILRLESGDPYDLSNPNYFSVNYNAVKLEGGEVTVSVRVPTDYFGAFSSIIDLTIENGYVPIQSIYFRESGYVNVWTNTNENERSAILQVNFIPQNATYKKVTFAKTDGQLVADSIRLEVIDDITCKVTALKYDGGDFTNIRAIAVDDTSITTDKQVYSNTECKGIEIEPHIIVEPFNNTYNFNINFLSGGYGGVNREFIVTALSSVVLKNNNCNLTWNYSDDYEGTWETVHSTFTSDECGSATFEITDTASYEKDECFVQVGRYISSVRIRGDLVDWESYDIGDDVLIPIIIEPNYWYHLKEDNLTVVSKPDTISINDIYSTQDDGTGFISIHLNSIIPTGSVLTVKSNKNNITDSYKFDSQIGTIKISNIEASIDGDLNMYHSTHNISYEVEPDNATDPTVKWTTDSDVLSFGNSYSDKQSTIYTSNFTGNIPAIITTDKATTVSVEFKAQDKDEFTGTLDLTIGKKMESYEFIVSGNELVDFKRSQNILLIKGPAVVSIDGYTEDDRVLNGLIDYTYSLPSFVQVSENHDLITEKPTHNSLELDFTNINAIGESTLNVDPQDGIYGINKAITVKYGNDITNIYFDQNNIASNHSILEVVNDIFYLDILAGANFTDEPVNLRAMLNTTYINLPPTVYDTVWTNNSDQFEQYEDNLVLHQENLKYFIQNDGIIYKNSNAEASQATIIVKTADDRFTNVLKISSIGIKFKNNAPISFINGEYVYNNSVETGDSINIINMVTCVPNTQCVSILNITPTSDLEDLVDYTITGGTIRIDHIKSYDYDESKPIGVNINIKANTMSGTLSQTSVFVRLKLVAMNYMTEFRFNNNSYTEEMYTDNFDPDSTNNYYTKNISIIMKGQDEHAIPDDYLISDVVFGSSSEISEFDSYETPPTDYKLYKVNYKLNRPGTNTITAETDDEEHSTSASLTIYGVQFDQKSIDLYTEIIYDLAQLVIYNGLPEYGNIVYEVDSSISDPGVVQVNRSTGLTTVNNAGTAYIKAFYDQYSRLFDYIKIIASVEPTAECTNISVLDSSSVEVETIYIRDNTDQPVYTLIQQGASGNLKKDVQLQNIEIINDDYLDYTVYPGSINGNYPQVKINSDGQLLHVGETQLRLVSWDGNITKNVTLLYGNEILNQAFPDEYSNYKINLSDQPIVKKLKLSLTCQYPGYKPSSNCTWTSSNPSMLSVDTNGTLEKESGKYNFYTTFTLGNTIGNVTITATTSKGSVQFNIVIYDADAPVEANMLNIHRIDMVYTNDPLQYQLENISAISGITEWKSNKTGLATISDTGLVTIVNVPDEDQFNYYDIEGDPLEEVYTDFYIELTVQTEMIKYVDRCLVHVVGESKLAPTVKLIHDDFVQLLPDESANIKFIATPYYVRNNDNNDTIVFTNTNDPDVPDPIINNDLNNPMNFDANGEAIASLQIESKDVINQIITDESEFQDIAEALIDGELFGEYDFGEIYDPSEVEFDYDFSDTPEYVPDIDDGDFNYGEVGEEIPEEIDHDYGEEPITFIDPDVDEGYDFLYINYDELDVGPKDTPFDYQVLNREYNVKLNPKYLYGAGTVDTNITISIVN